MRLHIEHETTFSYSQPVREAIGEAKLRPRNDAGQRLIGFRLALDPHTPFDVVADRFGNAIYCYSVLPAHRRLVVTATSEVETSAESLIAAPELTLLEQHSFTTASPYVPLADDQLAFARANAPADADPEATARALAGAIYDSCVYEPGSTTISTTADAVLAGRRGVCQDFAHLLIALCRAGGLPARYISGYLFDPSKPADAVLASHAWTEVYLDGRGWLGLDPTHNRATGPLYTRVAIGRDSADAAPVRGIYQGDADETLEVRVRMRALGEPAPIAR
ncbi:MAG TPA: transglutaminase family protein [Roseiflexaceae bacterium]|nr:transglutaminase family protein [Roseiflexaceae bacterium]